jgi:hypothetical protein
MMSLVRLIDLCETRLFSVTRPRHPQDAEKQSLLAPGIRVLQFGGLNSDCATQIGSGVPWFLTEFHLSIIQQADHDDAAGDISERCGGQPGKVVGRRDVSGQKGG